MNNFFIEYLKLPGKESGLKLSEYLREAGFIPEANALTIFFSENAQCVVADASMLNIQGGDVFISVNPPKNVTAGDIWFDIIELTPYVFELNSEEWSDRLKGWYAVRPIYYWQFIGFSESVILNHRTSDNRIKMIGKSNELYSAFNSTNFVTNINQPEAVLFSLWFGKEIIGDGLSNLQSQAGTALIHRILPEGLYIWDNSVATTGYHIIVDRTTLLSDTEEYIEEAELSRKNNLGFITFLTHTEFENINLPISMLDGKIEMVNCVNRKIH